MKLRDYQVKSIGSATAALRKHDRVALILPTGSGKTIVASRICKEFQPVAWIAHRKELLSQAANVLEHSNIDHTIVSAFTTNVPERHFKLIVVDEYHHEPCTSYRQLLNKMTYDKLLGITATRHRLDNIAVRFDEVIEEISVEQLIDEGYLAEINLVRVRSNGDIITDLASWANMNASHIGQTIFFVPNLKTANIVKDKIRISSDIIHGSSDRNTQLKAFTDGDIQCLISCLVLTEGVDLPICKTVILGRQTHSRAMMSQMVGRALRLFDIKHSCNIVEPALIYSTKKYASVSDVVTPNKKIISSPDVFQNHH